MKLDKVYSFLFILILGWGIVLIQGTPDIFGDTAQAGNETSEVNRDEVEKIRRRVFEVKHDLEEMKEDKTLRTFYIDNIEEIEDKVHEIQSLMKINQIEGQLYSDKSLNTLSTRIAELNRAYWLLKSQTHS